MNTIHLFISATIIHVLGKTNSKTVDFFDKQLFKITENTNSNIHLPNIK